MAQEVQRFSVTIPHGTPIATPVTVKTEFGFRVVREIEIIIPPGPRGNMGFQIAQAGRQVFPYTPGGFIVTDNEQIRWPIEDANTSGAWAVIGYNVGTFDHTIEVRYLVDLPPDPTSTLAPLAPSSISGP